MFICESAERSDMVTDRKRKLDSKACDRVLFGSCYISGFLFCIWAAFMMQSIQALHLDASNDHLKPL